MLRPLFFLACAAAPVLAADELSAPPKPDVGPSPEVSLKTMTVEPGLRAEVWAAEPLLENPVAFAFDAAGRAYIAETNRRRTSTPDIRRDEEWVPEMMSFRTVADRVAFLQKELAPEKKLHPGPTRPDLNHDGQFDWRDLTVESERVKVVEDADGDGKADEAHVLAEDFHGIATGTGAGVLPLPSGDVLYTCIPDLWLIHPDGTKKSLSTGYGVHIAYSGHDMHGLRMGPDGRVYFSIADTGASVAGPNGQIVGCPDGGAVFRCWPDGSELEMYAKGLRNPQDLTFNDVGDLFTGDNNADGGDKARLIHVVEGADYGWRIGWQFLPKLGAWNSEGRWHLDASQTNPEILPPVALIGHGPAGFTYYPGTGLPEKYRGHFFMADFPGGVRHFALKPQGASYTTADFAPDARVLQNNQAAEMTAKLVWNLYPSDVQFAPGGGVYVLDWVQGWEKTGKGRIFKFSAPELEKDPLIAETKRLLKEGLAGRPADELAKLLGHPDQRVRMAAQFEMVKTPAGVAALAEAAKAGKGLARLHAIWGLALEARTAERNGKAKSAAVAETLLPLLGDPEPEVRAQAAKACGEVRLEAARAGLLARFADDNPRVRFFAAQALGALGSMDKEAKAPDNIRTALFKLLADNADRDPFLRFAAAWALAHYDGTNALSLAAENPNASVRLGVLLAMSLRPRDFGRGYMALARDPSPLIRDTVTRLGYADRLEQFQNFAYATDAQVEPLDPLRERRALTLALLHGRKEETDQLAATAANPAVPVDRRVRVLETLAQFPTPPAVDPITGLALGLKAPRVPEAAKDAFAAKLMPLLADPAPALREAALEAAAALCPPGAEPALAQALAEAGHPLPLRVACLRALDKMGAPQAPAALQTALANKDRKLGEAARHILANRSPDAALAQAIATLKKGAIPEQQEAIATLGRLDRKEADQQLTNLLYKMKTGKLPAALHLDVLEAAAQRSDPTVLGMIKEWDKARPKKDPLAAWQECLEGGEAEHGQRVFAENAEGACTRCHAVARQGGDVGPDLAGIASRHDRAYLLRSIVDPNADIAAGFDNVLVTLQDGNIVAGLATSETADTLTLKNVADGKPQIVNKANIKERQKLPSAMPPGLGDVLGKRDLRDVVAYLSTLK